MKKCRNGIYKIINIINQKCYTGSAINFSSRWAKHKKDLLQNKHHSKHLQRAWNKYGKTNFKFEVVEFIEKIENKIEFKKYLLEREQYYIDLFDSYNNGYNECPIAGSRLGSKATEETKLKQHNSLKGRIFSEDHRKKLSESAKSREISEETIEKFRKRMTGVKLSEETKLKMSESRTGLKRNEEQKNNISKALKGRKLSNEHKQKLSEVSKEIYKDKNNHPWTNKHHSEESKQKMKKAKLGKKVSDETKLKMSEQRKGDKHPNSKLTEKDVIHIKNMLKNGEKSSVISKAYNVKSGTIRNIKNKRTWSHVCIDQ